MFYTIYRITNLINNTYYIGKHQTKKLDDNYMGSGKLIKAAINKHGIENFKKEMNQKEAELVTEELIASGNVYNICPGGQGGWGYINKNLPNPMLGKKQSDKQKAAVSFFAKNMVRTPEMIEKIASKHRGVKRSKETCKNISNTCKGLRYYTNGTKNIKRKEGTQPEGFWPGRCL